MNAFGKTAPYVKFEAKVSKLPFGDIGGIISVVENSNDDNNIPAEQINEYHIKSNNDLKVVVQLLRNKKQVVILLDELSASNKTKIIDFLSGACYALKCDMKKVDDNKYILN